MSAAPITAACLTYDPSLTAPAVLVDLAAEKLKKLGLTSSARDLEAQKPANLSEAVEHCSRYVRLQRVERAFESLHPQTVEGVRRAIEEECVGKRRWHYAELMLDPGRAFCFILWRDREHERIQLSSRPLEKPLLPADFKMLPETEQAAAKSALATALGFLEATPGDLSQVDPEALYLQRRGTPPTGDAL